MPSFVFVEKSNAAIQRRARIRVCGSFACRLRGLMFRRRLPEDEGLLLVGARDSRIDSSIHMLFVPFDLAVFWISSAMAIVDKAIARRWRPVYVPALPARFILEVHPALFSQYEIGENVEFVDA
jgi:uncharacterized membrane protein (UPF0127 family)